MQYSRLEMEWPAINFPEIYFKFFSNYLFISIPFFSFACIRTNTHEWNFFNRSLVGKLTEVIDEMGNIFVKITRVHESVIDTRERSNIGVLKVSGIERCDLYTWNKNPLTGESKFRIGSSNVYDVNERFWHVVEEIVGKKNGTKVWNSNRNASRNFFFPFFPLPPSIQLERCALTRVVRLIILTVPFVTISPPWPENTVSHSGVFHDSLSPLRAGRREQWIWTRW